MRVCVCVCVLMGFKCFAMQDIQETANVKLNMRVTCLGFQALGFKDLGCYIALNV